MSHHTEDAVCPLCCEKLQTAHAYMRDWFLNEVKPKYPNCHVAWAYRGQEDQEKAFAEGRTRAHYPNSPHNRVNPDSKLPESMALDLFQLSPTGIALFDPTFYAKLNQENQWGHKPIRWGGLFKHLGDTDHFELHEPYMPD